MYAWVVQYDLGLPDFFSTMFIIHLQSPGWMKKSVPSSTSCLTRLAAPHSHPYALPFTQII